MAKGAGKITAPCKNGSCYPAGKIKKSCFLKSAQFHGTPLFKEGKYYYNDDTRVSKCEIIRYQKSQKKYITIRGWLPAWAERKGRIK